MIVENGPENQGLRKSGTNSGLTLLECSSKPEIIKDLKDQRICRKFAILTSQCVVFSQMQQNHTLELSNIATATQANRTSVALLT